MKLHPPNSVFGRDHTLRSSRVLGGAAPANHSPVEQNPGDEAPASARQSIWGAESALVRQVSVGRRRCCGQAESVGHHWSSRVEPFMCNKGCLSLGRRLAGRLFPIVHPLARRVVCRRRRALAGRRMMMVLSSTDFKLEEKRPCVVPIHRRFVCIGDIGRFVCSPTKACHYVGVAPTVFGGTFVDIMRSHAFSLTDALVPECGRHSITT
jgi:hypothetical protein